MFTSQLNVGLQHRTTFYYNKAPQKTKKQLIILNNIFDVFFTDAPRLSCQMLYEVEVEDTPKPLCNPEGLPLPNITWFKNGKEHFPQRWEKNESGNYSVKAFNKHGTAEHMFYLDILCKSKLYSLLYAHCGCKELKHDLRSLLFFSPFNRSPRVHRARYNHRSYCRRKCVFSLGS